MASDGHDEPGAHRRNQSANAIPLQTLSTSGLQEPADIERSGSHRRTLSDRGRALFRGGRESLVNKERRYAPIHEGSPSLPIRQSRGGPLSPQLFVSSPSGQHERIPDEDDEAGFSPVSDRGAFQAAIGFAGLSFNAGSESPDEPEDDDVEETPPRYPRPHRATLDSLPTLRTDSVGDMVLVQLDDGPAFSSPGARDEDDDTLPLTDSSRLGPSSLAAPTTPDGQRHDRQRRPSPGLSGRFSPSRHSHTGSRLGDDLRNLEAGSHTPESGISRSPLSRKRSLSPSSAESPLQRTGTMLRKMSQRVVNLSNEPEPVERHMRRKPSMRQAGLEAPPTVGEVNVALGVDGNASTKSPASEKMPSPVIEPQMAKELPVIDRNPLRGKSLGVFSKDSKLRQRLLSFLVHPLTEPGIMFLIVIQTVVLAVDSGRNVFDHPRPTRWGHNWTDWTLFFIFILYTIEIVIKVIVSGFIFNPIEYSTIDRSIGIRQALYRKANDLFALQRKPSQRQVGGTHLSATGPVPPSLLRSFTAQNFDDLPGGSRQAQKKRLAYRAFLRHSFNRVDFLAVLSYWMAFLLGAIGVESQYHTYVFRMLSCLRIVRLLGITSGTSIILRSLKRAAPTLLNVAFLIGFFWLLFAIIGVQSFKASLRRTCVWDGTNADPPQDDYVRNQINSFQFCGGWLAANGSTMPWLTQNGGWGIGSHKGYVCPLGSRCIEGLNPYNNTVSFDNIGNSLELVFVIMTSNTFTDLMYYLTDSEYLAAALFFAFGIVIMSLWLMNLLIAVITSSFQVIREESRSSAFMATEKDSTEYNEKAEENLPKRRSRGLKKAYEKSKWMWIIIIVYGIIVQTLRNATMHSDTAKFINTSELAITLILLGEIIFRFLCDWRGFPYQRCNWVDLGLAIITTTIQIPAIRNSAAPYAWLSVFQILRIYRVVMAVPITSELIQLVLRHVSGLLNLILFVFLLNFLAAIFAVQLFRGELPSQDDQGNTVQVTFSTIYNAFLGMYQVLSSENWTTILYNVTRFDNHWGTAWIGAGFLILWYILANFIVLNMFIAVIQENFDVNEDQKRMQQVRMFLQQKELGSGNHGTLSLSTIFKFGNVRQQDPLDFGSAATEMLLKDAVVRDFLDDQMEPYQSHEQSSASTLIRRSTTNILQPRAGLLTRWYDKVIGKLFHGEPNPFYARLQLTRPHEELDPRTLAREVVSAAEQRKVSQREYLRRHPKYNRPLWIFRPQNPVRRFCQRIVGPGRGKRIQGVQPDPRIWYIFSAFIYAAIVAMVLLACVTTPLYQKDYFATRKFTAKNWFIMTDLGFAALFTVEAIIKVIADGFFFTPNAYFRSSWGFIDGVVLITLWVNVITALYDPRGGSRAVGAFKALRALRLLNVSDSAKDTFHSVIVLGGWKVVSAAFVSLSLLIPFAIYGLNLFSGKMMQCNDGNSNIYNLTDCVGEYLSSPYNWEVLAPRQVANSYYNFDNFGGSLFILFQIVSQEGWIDVRDSAQAITGVFAQPNPLTSQGNALFFIVFNLLGAVFVLTLFVSVFMRNYTEQTGVAFLTTDQRSWLELRKLLRQVSPTKRPSTKKKREGWQEWCYRRAVTKTGRWQRTITGVLIVHLILLCLDFYPDVWGWDRTRDYVFLVFTLLYIANIVIRIIGLSWTRFRNSAWDLYSVCAVSGTFITTVLLLSNFKERDYVQLHKLFLVSVALLLIPRNNQLDQLFKTAAASLTSIANLLATWFVLFLVYAIALTQTFGLTRFNTHETDNINVRTVPKALILLFRTSSGEGWNQIMHDFATVTRPYCTIGERYFDGDCGSANWASALFISWNILSMYIFVNLFISLIYESFSYVYQRSSGLSVISREEIRRFKQAWAEFDPNGTGYISKEVFPRFLGELSGVFEMRIYDGDFTVRSLLEDCKLRPARASALPMDGTSANAADEIDLDMLNRRLAELPVDEIRRRRARMNTFYEEVIVSADPDRGISFSALLMILAHYKVINDNKSLRLEEFLRRRARLQRVEEAVNRNIVVGFFDTLYWTRRFRRLVNNRKHARVTEIPQLDVPEIFVHDEGGADVTQAPRFDIPSVAVTPVDYDPSDTANSLSIGTAPGASGNDAGTPGSSQLGSVLRNKSGSVQSSPSTSPTRETLHLSATHSPGHRSAGSQGSIQPDWYFAAALADATSGLSPPGSPRLSSVDPVSRSRANSAVSQHEMMGMFDASAWGESMRRSQTMRDNRRPSS